MMKALEHKVNGVMDVQLTLPKQPWQIVACDCFEVSGSLYCVYVDTYSDYIELCELEDLWSETLIEKTKQVVYKVFSIHGIPLTLISDNGPNYSSKDCFMGFSAYHH